VVRLLTGTVLAIALAAVGSWLAFGRDEPPPPGDPALERAVLPVVDAHLSQGPWRGLLSHRHPGAAWFCSVDVIELRREGGNLKAGVDAWCDEYAPSGDRLLAGSGEHTPKLVTLSGGPDHYEVRHVESPSNGASHWPSIQRMFSEATQTELQRRQGRPSQWLPDPAIEARQAFGLPPDAPVEPAR
jgi:hypothetical protein